MSFEEDDRIKLYQTLAEAKANFGINYADFVFALTRAQVEALLNGQVVAFDISGREYAGFLTLKEESEAKSDESQSIR